MVDYLRMRRDDGADGWVIQHIQAPERAAALVECGRELFGCEPMWVSEVGPVIGTYTGPGLIGVAACRRGCCAERTAPDAGRGGREPRYRRRRLNTASPPPSRKPASAALISAGR